MLARGFFASRVATAHGLARPLCLEVIGIVEHASRLQVELAYVGSRLNTPLALDDMRESADFQPPRSYWYITHSTITKFPAMDRRLAAVEDG
jgi:hypothetical protein